MHVQNRLRAWVGHVTLEKGDVEQMLNEFRWLKRRLQRVEEAIAPFVADEMSRSGVRRSSNSASFDMHTLQLQTVRPRARVYSEKTPYASATTACKSSRTPKE